MIEIDLVFLIVSIWILSKANKQNDSKSTYYTSIIIGLAGFLFGMYNIVQYYSS